jgi:uncharacterized membrane protein
MIRRIGLYLATLAVFLAIDSIWLGLAARTFYHDQLGFLMAPSLNWLAAGAFYLLYVAGILVFVVLPGLGGISGAKVFLQGGFFGLVAYATYDLTNFATMQDWPVTVTLVDLAWGFILTGMVSVSGWWIARRLSGPVRKDNA